MKTAKTLQKEIERKEQELTDIQSVLDAYALAIYLLDKEKENAQGFANIPTQLYREQWQNEANRYGKSAETLRTEHAKGWAKVSNICDKLSELRNELNNINK